MRKIKYLFAIFGLLCLAACQTSKSDVGDKSVVIDWDNSSLGHFDIEEVEYVPLETTDSSLLGSISKVLFRNNCFYVLDKMSGGVYVFDRKGNFLSSIVRPGEGPEEYIELMDMDVDEEGNVYIADNARMKILKYRFPKWELDKTFDVGTHYWEFCCLDEDCFLLKDVFGEEGLYMKLAHYDGKTQKVVSLKEKAFASINESDVMKCSKFNLYRSGNQLYYYERFTPNIYSVSAKGDLTKVYTIESEDHIPEGDLEELEKNPMKFIQEKKYIKDIIGLYENEEYFVCMPFISPSGVCLFIPKDDITRVKRIDLSQKEEFLGASLIEGVADGKFFSFLKTPNKKALENNPHFNEMEDDANPILMLFSLKVN